MFRYSLGGERCNPFFAASPQADTKACALESLLVRLFCNTYVAQTVISNCIAIPPPSLTSIKLEELPVVLHGTNKVARTELRTGEQFMVFEI